jgi:hypothetical protein
LNKAYWIFLSRSSGPLSFRNSLIWLRVQIIAHPCSSSMIFGPYQVWWTSINWFKSYYEVGTWYWKCIEYLSLFINKERWTKNWPWRTKNWPSVTRIKAVTLF